MKYYFKKHRIKIFFLLVLSLIVFGCSFLIKEVNVKQENEAGEMVAYIKAGEIATFTFSGEINIDGAMKRLLLDSWLQEVGMYVRMQL